MIVKTFQIKDLPVIIPIDRLKVRVMKMVHIWNTAKRTALQNKAESQVESYTCSLNFLSYNSCSLTLCDPRSASSAGADGPPIPGAQVCHMCSKRYKYLGTDVPAAYAPERQNKGYREANVAHSMRFGPQENQHLEILKCNGWEDCGRKSNRHGFPWLTNSWQRNAYSNSSGVDAWLHLDLKEAGSLSPSSQSDAMLVSVGISYQTEFSFWVQKHSDSSCCHRTGSQS